MNEKDGIDLLLRDWAPAIQKLLETADTPQWRLYAMMHMGTEATHIMAAMVRDGRLAKETFPAVEAVRERITELFENPPSGFVELVLSLHQLTEQTKVRPDISERERQLFTMMQGHLHAVVFTPPSGIVTVGQAASDLNEFAAFVSELKKETDRGAALVGAAVIDNRLRRLLSSHLQPDLVAQVLVEDNPMASLGGLSSRVRACYALGLLTRTEYDECQVIRGIRNDFAHRIHGLSFADPSIADRCKNLKGVLPTSGTPRQRFIDAVILLCMVLWYRPAHAEPFRSVARRWPWQLLRARTSPEDNKDRKSGDVSEDSE